MEMTLPNDISEPVHYLRPIQYLGAKGRTIEAIIGICRDLYRPGSAVVDLFSGSSVVSQALYYNGMSVISNDALAFCCDIAAGMLYKNSRARSADLVSDVSNGLQDYLKTHQLEEAFQAALEQEERLLRCRDLEALQSLYTTLPQMGKSHDGNAGQIEYIGRHLGEKAGEEALLVANYYAGTYFGIKQAICIDAIRLFIEKKFRNKEDEWTRGILLTALYSTCSAIVHSAGKHFAQPIPISDFNLQRITNKRLFTNRTYDVERLFLNNLTSITKQTGFSETSARARVLQFDICTPEFAQALTGEDISVIYADPPYTAQQYSRFYHILEVLHEYRYPKLQEFRGRITQGIYPEYRHKSAFCSKSKVKEAFTCIFELAKKHNAHLVLSYSESRNKTTGNERMISTEEIIRMGSSIMKKCSVRQTEMPFFYKQLNSKLNIVASKDDREILIIFIQP